MKLYLKKELPTNNLDYVSLTSALEPNSLIYTWAGFNLDTWCMCAVDGDDGDLLVVATWNPVMGEKGGVLAVLRWQWRRWRWICWWCSGCRERDVKMEREEDEDGCEEGGILGFWTEREERKMRVKRGREVLWWARELGGSRFSLFFGPFFGLKKGFKDWLGFE